MTKTMTGRDCFARYGVTPINERWAWSGRNEETKTVVACLWKDGFRKEDGKMVYGSPVTKRTAAKQGFKARMKDFQFALDHCDGKFRVIMVVAKDTKADPRSIAECYPTKMTMKVTYIDPETGWTRAEQV